MHCAYFLNNFEHHFIVLRLFCRSQKSELLVDLSASQHVFLYLPATSHTHTFVY